MTSPSRAGAASPRRILYVHNSADLYGASRSLLRLVTALDRTRFEPFVVLPERGILEERIRGLGVNVAIEPALAIVSRYSSKLAAIFYRFPVSVWRLLRLIRHYKIDLVHTNTATVFSAALAAWLAQVPHVWHIRESFEEFRGWKWNVYSTYMRWFSARVISVSSANAAQFSRRANVAVIHNGFPISDFAAPTAEQRITARQQFGLREDDFVTGCVGRIKWVRKGQEFLIHAAALLKQRGLRAKHLIVGAPYTGNESHLERLQLLARDLHVEGEIIFTGELIDTRAAYWAMDLFVLPSAQPEPLGGVVIEAMAYSRPVIATNIGGSRDQVENGATGYLIPPGDPEAIAEKITLLMRDRERLREMGRAGRARAEALFNVEKMTQQIQALYDEVLAKQPGTS